MEWSFIRTERDHRDSVYALLRIPDSVICKNYRRQQLLLLALVSLGMGFFSWLEYGHLRAAALLTGLVLLLAVDLVLGRWLFVRSHLRNVRIRMKGYFGPCTVRLAYGSFHVQCGDGENGAADWHCPVSRLDRAQAVRGGAVVLLKDGRAEYLPLSAFSEDKPLPAFVDAVNMAVAQAAQEAPRIQTPPRHGLVGQTLFYCMTEPELKALHRECSRAALRTWDYWYAQRRPLLILAVLLLFELIAVGWAAFWTMLALAAVMVVLLAVFNGRRAKNLDNFLGEQSLELCEDELCCRRAAGEWRYPYKEFPRLMETGNAWFLFSGRQGLMLLIPKSAFADEAEQAAFLALLRQRMAA